MQITKAVIPAAGLGTRLKPVSNVLPKELLPVVNKPSLYFVLEEIEAAGLKEVILVVSPTKKPFFEHLKEVFPLLHFKFIIQEKALGLGHAVLLAEEAVAGEPFMILLPDIIIDHEKSASLQLLEVFQKIKKSLNATQHVAKDRISHYGIYEMTRSEGRLHQAKRVIEKPSKQEAPSDLAVVGRYLFTPDLFPFLKKTPPSKNGEIQLADAMNTMAGLGELYAYEVKGVHLDIGNPLGLIRANIYYGMKEYGKRLYQGLVDL